MTKVTVEFDQTFRPSDEGPFLLRMEQVLRAWSDQDIRVLKRRKGDDSLLRIKRTT